MPDLLRAWLHVRVAHGLDHTIRLVDREEGDDGVPVVHLGEGEGKGEGDGGGKTEKAR